MGRRREIAFVLSACVFTVAATGCLNVEFTQTARWTKHEQHGRPRVFIDRRPPREYVSVGIIEVKGDVSASLREIMDAAAEKGEEVGCDVVVERSLHTVGAVGRGRWFAMLEADVPLRRPSAGPAAPVRASPWFSQVQPVVFVSQQQRREFICGVWREL
jgi:hypothetical protein